MSSMFDLSGKTSVVTGGNGGVGLAFCRGLVRAGGRVAIWARNNKKNADAVAELRDMGGDVEAFVCDVTDENQVVATFAETLKRFDKVDACFANAGGAGFRGMAHLTSREDWLATIDLNLMSVVHTFAPVTEHMLSRGDGGKLVVTSSVAALLGTGGAAGYSTTKAAVRGLVQALAIELGQGGIQVNAVLPGFIKTEMSVQTSAAFQDACRRRSAIGRIGQLRDMEGIAVFLASDYSDFMTGQSIIMDGGHTIHPM
ncbi:MAG: SDR family oxidoreductase [Pseudomonadota bacterium]